MSEEDDRNRYQNTCHFLRLNSNNRKYNYSLTEIQNILEHDKLPNTTLPPNREAGKMYASTELKIKL